MEYHLWPGTKTHYDIHIALRKLGFQVLRLKPIEDYGLVYAMRLWPVLQLTVVG